VVTLRCMGELSFAEIGACLGVPEPTARTLFQRAKAMLRKALTGQVDIG
jgi:DNA-directed RNA polymerase specialized sigma24 family protein